MGSKVPIYNQNLSEVVTGDQMSVKRLWLLKNSSFLPNSQNLGDTKCPEN